MLGSELWEDDLSSLFSAVKVFIVDVWESRKLRLYACPAPSLTPRGGMLFRMVSCGMAGVAS